MIKVMQAAGRVIRSPEDRGVVLLIDERFGYPSYQSLFPPEWAHARKISSSTLSPLLKAFWKKK
jgi:DNA excision repair protein ERCC-2